MSQADTQRTAFFRFCCQVGQLSPALSFQQGLETGTGIAQCGTHSMVLRRAQHLEDFGPTIATLGNTGTDISPIVKGNSVFMGF